MISMFLQYLLVFPLLLVVVDGTGVQKNFQRQDRYSTKRSDGLLADVVNLLVAEKREREIILGDNKAMKESMKKMKKSLATSVADFTKQSSRQFKEMQNQLDTIKHSVTALTKRSSNQFTDMQKQLSAIKNQPEKQVIAFTAAVRGVPARNSNQVIPFKNVITNIGGGYNKTDSVFYCPVSGVYSFHVTITAYTDNVYAHIRKNDQFVASVFNGQDGKDNWAVGSTMVYLQLQRGDKVAVTSPQKCIYHANSSYFSGMKL